MRWFILGTSEDTISEYTPKFDEVNEAFIRNFSSVWRLELEQKLSSTFPVNEVIERRVRLMV